MWITLLCIQKEISDILHATPPIFYPRSIVEHHAYSKIPKLFIIRVHTSPLHIILIHTCHKMLVTLLHPFGREYSASVMTGEWK